MAKVTYNKNTGLVQEQGEGFDIDGKASISNDSGTNDEEALNITRCVTIKTSPSIGVTESSGSLLMLKGRGEGLFFHLGGNQYISNNSWFDASRDLTPESASVSGMWVYENDDAAAFRWGFRGGAGCFDLNFAIQGEAGTPVTGSMWHPTSGSWGVGLSLSASNGAVTVGKKADRSTVTRWNDGGIATVVRHGANAQFDVSGSVKASSNARSLAVAVTGSAEFGCGAPDGYIIFPLHNNTTRAALTAIEGMVIYNTETHKLNFYNGSGWKEVAGEDV